MNEKTLGFAIYCELKEYFFWDNLSLEEKTELVMKIKNAAKRWLNEQMTDNEL